MNMRGVLTLSAAFVGLSASVFAQNTPRIGRILIVGNTDTPDGVILERLALFPGAPLASPDVDDAEKRLRRSGLFVVDARRQHGPRVRILESAGAFKDIIVQVQEKPWNWAVWSARHLMQAALRADAEQIHLELWRLIDRLQWAGLERFQKPQ